MKYQVQIKKRMIANNKVKALVDDNLISSFDDIFESEVLQIPFPLRLYEEVHTICNDVDGVFLFKTNSHEIYRYALRGLLSYGIGFTSTISYKGRKLNIHHG